MAIRMSSDEKYRDLRDQMEEATRNVAKWPSWMIDTSYRQSKEAAARAENEGTTSASLETKRSG